MKNSVLVSRYTKAKKEFLLDRMYDMRCDGCGRIDKPLSVSHTISRDRCQKIGRPELYYAKFNFELMCFNEGKVGEGACHEVWESGLLERKQRLLNWDRMMKLVEEYDPEMYQRIVNFGK